MATKDHYVSKFHISKFVDPSVPIGQSDWTWVVRKEQAIVKRKSPSNFAWKRGMFSKMSLNIDPPMNMEKYLSEKIEGPASSKLIQMESLSSFSNFTVPEEITRYLAWAAARSLSMQELYQKWFDSAPSDIQEMPMEGEFAWMSKCKRISRSHRMEKDGEVQFVFTENVDEFRRNGWRFVMEGDDVAETIHLQAILLRNAFAKLCWAVISAPPRNYFVLGDRPVFWKMKEKFDCEPKWLQHEDILVVAPLTKNFALIGAKSLDHIPSRLSAPHLNYMSMTAARHWVAGPTQQCINEMLVFSFDRLSSMLVDDT